MRDLEFLPTWYNQLRRQRRMLMLEMWLVVAVVGGLTLWMFLANRNKRVAELTLHSLRDELGQTNTQLKQMDHLESLRGQWRRKAEVLGRLGEHVQAGRLIAKLDDVMPVEVSLLSLMMEAEETPVSLSGAVRAAMKDPAGVVMDRRLRIRMQGVAPTDVELATLLTELNKVPFLEHVAPTYARDRREAGHILREFELTFTVNLNAPAGS